MVILAQIGSYILLQDAVYKLKGDLCLDQELEELEGITRTGPCKQVSAALQGHHLGLAQQEIGQTDHIPFNCLV